MKKIKILCTAILGILFLVPLGKLSLAETNGYIGVSEGQEYKWKVNLHVEGLDEVVSNVDDLLLEMQGELSNLDLFGYENMTIPEVMVNLSHEIASRILAPGWETMNFSTLIDSTLKYYLTEFNKTALAGELPANWESLNYSTFISAVVNGLNETLSPGWEDDVLIPLIELAVNQFNDTLLFGLLPNGWEDLSLQEIFDIVLDDVFPEAKESFLTCIFLKQFSEMMLAELPLDTSIEDLLTLSLPTLNLTYILDGLWYMLNESNPPGWESDNMTTLFDNGFNTLDDYLKANVTFLPIGFDTMSISEIIQWAIDEALQNATASVPPDTLPNNWTNMTIINLLDAQFDLALTYWNEYVITNWNTIRQYFGISIPTTIGIKIDVEDIGIEVESCSGGPQGTPIDLSLYLSLDMKNWTSIDELFGDFFVPSMAVFEEDNYSYEDSGPFDFLSNFTYIPHIVNPSTYSNEQLAMIDQFMFTGCFIMATNYDWENLNTTATVQLPGKPNAFEVLINWNSNGLLTAAYLKANGETAISILIFQPETEIPGFDVTLIILIGSVSIVGIIYYFKKKPHFK